MAAHTYWALRLYPRIGAGGGIAVAEIEMRDSVGGSDLCVGGTPSGSFTTGTVSNVFDDNNATYAYNGSSGVSLRVSYAFLAPVSIAEMYLRVPGAGTHSGTSFGPAQCVVEWSDDGITWTAGTGSFDASGLTNDQSITSAPVSDAPVSNKLLDPRFVHAQFAPTWPVTPKQLVPLMPSLLNVYHGGRGRISGTVKVKGTPNYAVHRKVRLVRERDAICVAEQWSDAVTGNYQFDYFDEREKYTVISYDYENNFRAVIADNLTPDIIT